MARLFDDSASNRLTLSGFAITTTPLTLAAWIYPDAAQQHIALSIGDTDRDTGDYFALIHRGDASGVVQAGAVQAGSGSSATSSAGISTNTWGHACTVFTSATSRAAYVNGANKGTDTGNITPEAVRIDSTMIGCLVLQNPTLFFSGRIAEVGIWSAALDDAEVAALGNGMSPQLIRPSALEAYIPIFGNASPETNRFGSPFTVSGTSKADHPRIIYPVGSF